MNFKKTHMFVQRLGTVGYRDRRWFFGIMGMIFAVPIFALFYSILSDVIESRLARKNIPIEADQKDIVETQPENDPDQVEQACIHEQKGKSARFHDQENCH